jgi:uncharacterized protein (DUF1778 family)
MKKTSHGVEFPKRTDIIRTFAFMPRSPQPKLQEARFDTRLSKSQKDLLEEAARLDGCRSLSEFVLKSAQAAADRIFEKQHQLLASERDRQKFIKALMHPPKPNASLRKAARAYNLAIGSK